METRSPMELYLAAMQGEQMPPAEEGPSMEEYLEDLMQRARQEIENAPPPLLVAKPKPKRMRPDFHHLRVISGGKN